MGSNLGVHIVRNHPYYGQRRPLDLVSLQRRESTQNIIRTFNKQVSMEGVKELREQGRVGLTLVNPRSEPVS